MKELRVSSDSENEKQHSDEESKSNYLKESVKKVNS